MARLGPVNILFGSDALMLLHRSMGIAGVVLLDAHVALLPVHLTERLGLPADRLVVTYFEGDAAVPRDSEAAALWAELAGLPAERIVALSGKDNFWAMGDTGTCGPCSEIYWDLQPEKGAHDFPPD